MSKLHIELGIISSSQSEVEPTASAPVFYDTGKLAAGSVAMQAWADTNTINVMNATLTYQTIGLGNTLFNTEVVDTANAWNGISYTIPSDGMYLIDWRIWWTTAASATQWTFGQEISVDASAHSIIYVNNGNDLYHLLASDFIPQTWGGADIEGPGAQFPCSWNSKAQLKDLYAGDVLTVVGWCTNDEDIGESGGLQISSYNKATTYFSVAKVADF